MDNEERKEFIKARQENRIKQMSRYKKDLNILPKRQKLIGELSGYQYLLERSDKGHLRGYIKVDGFKDVDFKNSNICRIVEAFSIEPGFRDVYIECHGGIIYDNINAKPGFYNKFPSERWIGFDCMHVGDWRPDCFEGTYRNTSFARAEIKKIIDQLVKLESEE